jgi:hypothetical protein
LPTVSSDGWIFTLDGTGRVAMTQTTWFVSDGDDLQQQTIKKFEIVNFPLKYEIIPKQIIAEHISEILPSFIQRFPECRECDDLLKCAGLALELKVNNSRVKKRNKAVVKNEKVPAGYTDVITSDDPTTAINKFDRRDDL